MYLDAPSFTRLFNDRRMNDAEIRDGLRAIADGVSSKFYFFDRNEAETTIADAVEYAVDQVERFDVTHPRANAFAYFTSVIRNRMRSRHVGRVAAV